MEEVFHTQEQPGETLPQEPEQIHIVSEKKPARQQHGDDVALTQCLLCIFLVLLIFGLHWVKPEWQTQLLQQYCLHREEPTLAWIDQLLHTVQAWIQR